MSMLLFIKVLLTEFIAEMGDKTQFMLIALTSKFKVRDILLGTAVAIAVLNGIAVLAGGLVGSLIPDWLIKLVAAAAFLYFAVTSLISDDDEEDAATKGNFSFAPLTVFCTFFVAELGDKTQLTAMTFGANEGLGSALIVWAACSLGLFAADVLGMLLVYMMKSRMPDGLLNTLAFIIFAVFGLMTLRQGLSMLFVYFSAGGAVSDGMSMLGDAITLIAALILVCLCYISFRKSRKNKNQSVE